MKCLVAVKRVVDPYASIRIKSDATGVEISDINMVMNPFDEIALEEAVNLKKQQKISEIIAVSIGPVACKEILRKALARGADKAILINITDNLLSLDVAKILQKLVVKEQASLVFLGKQAIDSDANQTGQMLSTLLSWPQACFASQVEISENKEHAVITREVDAGLETIQIKLPAVITADLRLNEPSYITLPNVMKAKSKPITELSAEDILWKPQKSLETLKVEAPAARTAGTKVEDVATLVAKLQEAKVL